MHDEQGKRKNIMNTPTKTDSTLPAPNSDELARLLQQYGCGTIHFAGTDNASYERHLVFDNVINPATACAREQFEAIALSVRDVLSQRWVRTEETYAKENPKRVYYLSMEFLIGRSLANNVTNLLARPICATGAQAAKSGLAGIARTGTGCRPGQRRTRPSRRVLSGFAGHDADSGDGLRPAL